MNYFSNRLRLETRALNIHGAIQVAAVTGKGHDSGWSRVRAGLEALGFRLESSRGNETEEETPSLAQRGISQILQVFKNPDKDSKTNYLIFDCGHWVEWMSELPPSKHSTFRCPECALPKVLA